MKVKWKFLTKKKTKLSDRVAVLCRVGKKSRETKTNVVEAVTNSMARGAKSKTHKNKNTA